jgi:hypothetical protein
MQKYLNVDTEMLLPELTLDTGPQFSKLNGDWALSPDLTFPENYLFSCFVLLESPLSQGFLFSSEAIAGLVCDYSLVSFIPLDITEVDSLDEVLVHVDNSFQYGEDEDVKIRETEEEDD